MRSLITGKKGDMTDLIVFVISIFILAIGLFIFIFIVPSITGGLRQAGLNNSITATNAINDVENNTLSVINYGFLFLTVGMFIAILISSFFITSHPIWMFLYFIFMIISVILSFYLGNVYQLMIHNPALASALANATFLNLVMGHIAEITIAIGALSIIIIFAKFGGGGGNGF